MGYKNIINTMPKPRPFIIEVKTDNAGSGSNQFIIPTTGTGYSYTVRTTNGVTSGNTGNVTITWPTAGTYEVEIYGDFPRIFFNGVGDIQKLLKVKQWGTIRWLNFLNAFRGCLNMDITAIDSPNLLSVTDMSSAFFGCSSLVNLNNSLGNWNTSSITSIRATFQNCINFNVPLDSWNTSNVTAMNNTFSGCQQFNQDIGSWDVSKVVNFFNMFNNATNFNNGNSDSIKNWLLKISGPVDLSGMFQNTGAFNQPLNWNTSAVINMSGMFSNATLFNQDIGSWTVSNVENFSTMFNNAFNFNNGNSDSIKNWLLKISGPVNLSGMFQNADAFNQPLNWNTSAVTTMFAMFNGSNQFNQDIGSWSVSNVMGFGAMFQNATNFNRNLGSWQLNLSLSGLVPMNEIFRNSGMSTDNYTDTIVGWANYVQTNSGTPANLLMLQSVSIPPRTFQNSRSYGVGFATAGAARTYLTSANPGGAGWTISGDTVIA